MPLRETEAIVLRTIRLGEADKIASLLTREWGRLRTVAAGARRPKSRWGATLEPMTYIRAWLFERENRDLLRLSSADLIESFFDMQTDFRLQVATQFICEVTERFLPEREANDWAFRLLLAVLKALKVSGEINRPLLYFDYWLLRLAGFLPDFERCHACGKQLTDGQGYYGPGAEGLLGEDCRTAVTPQQVSTAALREARQGCSRPLHRWLTGEKPFGGTRAARQFLEEVMEAHADKKLVTRELLNQQA